MNRGFSVISFSLMLGGVDLCRNNKMRRFCAVLTWHFYALRKWEGAENKQSPKVVSVQENSRCPSTDSSSIPLTSVGIWEVGFLPGRHLKYFACSPRI